jgi:ATP-dependent DNA helicase RecG
MSTAMLNEVLEALRRGGRERGVVEFKSNLDQQEEIGQYISALANTAALEGAERAWVVWGVADGSLDVKGTTFDPFSAKAKPPKDHKVGASNQSLVMWLQQMTQPRADFQFHALQHPQGPVVMLEIHPARSAPVAFQQVRYVRVDTHKVKLSDHPDKEARLWTRLAAPSDWTGEVVPGATLEDLDPDAVVMARQRFAEFLVRGETDATRHETTRAEVAAWDTTTLLNKAHVTKQGRITRAALLLLGRDEAAHFLAPVDTKISWILRDEGNNTVTSHPLGLPFLLATERAFAKVRNVTVDHMPDGTLFPTPVQRYDNWVVREALHNCVAHQDYTLGGKINLVEHPDKLVLSNLGQFIPPSVEWMLEHQSPPEHYRNQWLIGAMIRMRMIEQVGSGIRRMFTTQRQRLFPLPDYQFDADQQGRPRVELTLQGQILDVKFARALMSRSDLTLAQVLLLDRVQKGRGLAPHEARALRDLHLIEGRAPKYFISAKVADATGQKARYIHNRGLDDQHYQQLVLDYLKRFGQAARADLDALLLRKLPDMLDAPQKANKIKNLLQGMRRSGLVHAVGPRTAAVWHLGAKPGHPDLDTHKLDKP